MKKAENAEITFEAALARLEALVRTLEAGSEDLDASLRAFEEGISLVRFCTEKLETAEQKVKILLKDANGVSEVPFEEKGGDTL